MFTLLCSLALAQDAAPSGDDLDATMVQQLMDQSEKSEAFRAFADLHRLKKAEKRTFVKKGGPDGGGLCLRSVGGVQMVMVYTGFEPVTCRYGSFQGAVTGLPAVDTIELGETELGELVDAWGLPILLGSSRVAWLYEDLVVTVEARFGLERGSSIRSLALTGHSWTTSTIRTFGNAHRDHARLAKPRFEPIEGLWVEGLGARPEVARAAPAPSPRASSPAPAAQRPAPPPAPAAPAPARPEPVAPAYPSFGEPVRSGMQSPHDAAVVVGLEDYPFLGTDVPYAGRDAEAFRDLLVYTRGVPQGNVQVLTSGSREQILEAVDRAAREGKDGTVWLYFAGHGAAHPDTGERLLLGDDVRPTVSAFAARGAGVDELAQRLTAHGATAQLVLDACYTGASRSGGSIAGGTRFVVPTYAVEEQAQVAQWNAAAPDQVSHPLDEAQHGAFTYFAIGAMRGWADGELSGKPDGVVTSDEAAAYVHRALRGSGINDQAPAWVGAGTTLTSGELTRRDP